MIVNLFMSFSQFEREMTSDRVRDKMAAARRKEMWTGGVVSRSPQLVRDLCAPVCLPPRMDRRRSRLDVPARLLPPQIQRLIRRGHFQIFYFSVTFVALKGILSFETSVCNRQSTAGCAFLKERNICGQVTVCNVWVNIMYGKAYKWEIWAILIVPGSVIVTALLIVGSPIAFRPHPLVGMRILPNLDINKIVRVDVDGKSILSMQNDQWRVDAYNGYPAETNVVMAFFHSLTNMTVWHVEDALKDIDRFQRCQFKLTLRDMSGCALVDLIVGEYKHGVGYSGWVESVFVPDGGYLAFSNEVAVTREQFGRLFVLQRIRKKHSRYRPTDAGIQT